MDFCKLCKTDGETAGKCKNCGNSYFDGCADFIYGKTEKESFGCECILTNKYLIVRRVTKKEMLGGTAMVATGGLLGAAVNSAINKARKMTFGFYDINEFDKVIFPFNAKGIKTDTAFRIVNKDGSDFILHFDLNGMFCKKIAKSFQKALETAGIKIEQGSSEKQTQCCQKPFVNEQNFYLRVAPSAAKFVQLTEEQFVASPCVPGASANAIPEKASEPEDTNAVTEVAPTQEETPVIEEIAPSPVSEVVATTPETEEVATEVTLPSSDPAPAEPASEVETETKSGKFCGKCGFPTYVADQLFCAECGAKLL